MLRARVSMRSESVLRARKAARRAHVFTGAKNDTDGTSCIYKVCPLIQEAEKIALPLHFKCSHTYLICKLQEKSLSSKSRDLWGGLPTSQLKFTALCCPGSSKNQFIEYSHQLRVGIEQKGVKGSSWIDLHKNSNVSMLDKLSIISKTKGLDQELVLSYCF